MKAVRDSPAIRATRVVFVTHQFRHHSDHSGYDRIAELIPGRALRADALVHLFRPVPDRIFDWVRRGSGVEEYDRLRALTELRAALTYVSAPKTVFDFVYADHGF